MPNFSVQLCKLAVVAKHPLIEAYSEMCVYVCEWLKRAQIIHRLLLHTNLYRAKKKKFNVQAMYLTDSLGSKKFT